MKNSVLASGLGVLALTLSPLFFPASVAARDGFVMATPDLTSVDACVRKSRGNKIAAADCFDPYIRICQDRYAPRLNECLPQEVEFWRKTVEAELSRVNSNTARRVKASIDGDIAEHCNFDVLKYREGCRRTVYHQAAVYLRISRLWGGG